MRWIAPPVLFWDGPTAVCIQLRGLSLDVPLAACLWLSDSFNEWDDVKSKLNTPSDNFEKNPGKNLYPFLRRRDELQENFMIHDLKLRNLIVSIEGTRAGSIMLNAFKHLCLLGEISIQVRGIFHFCCLFLPNVETNHRDFQSLTSRIQEFQVF